MSVGAVGLSRQDALKLPPREGALSYDALLEVLQGAHGAQGQLIDVTWSTLQDPTWHKWTGTVATVMLNESGGVASIRVRFTDVQKDLDVRASESIQLDQATRSASFWIPGADLYIRSIEAVQEVIMTPENAAAVARGASEQREQKKATRAADKAAAVDLNAAKTQLAANQAKIAELTAARTAAQAELERLNAAVAAAQSEAQVANVRAQSEAATAAQAAAQLREGIAQHQALQDQYARGEGQFIQQHNELEALRAENARLRQYAVGRSPSPLVPAHAPPFLSPVDPTGPTATPFPRLDPSVVDTWVPYLTRDRVQILLSAIAAHYSVNHSSPPNVGRAYDSLRRLLELCAVSQPTPLIHDVLEDARTHLRSEVSRASGVHVERVADEMLRQDTKDLPFTNDARWQREVHADAAKARSNVRCRLCGLRGHIAANCRKSSTAPRQGGPKGGPRQE